jgi:hypothetical protein
MNVITAGILATEEFDDEFRELIHRALDPQNGAQLMSAIDHIENSPMFRRWVERGGLAASGRTVLEVRALAVAFAFGLFAAAQQGELKTRGRSSGWLNGKWWPAQ